MTALSTQLATGRWPVVCSLTSARFAVRNLGVNLVHGSIPVLEAWVNVDGTGRPREVHATLDLTRIDTGNRKRDSDLQKPNLLGTATGPTLTFDGVATEDFTAVHGTLQGKCATEIVLDAGMIEVREGGRATVHATTSFDRRDVGVRAPVFLIGRRIDVTIDATFEPPSV